MCIEREAIMIKLRKSISTNKYQILILAYIDSGGIVIVALVTHIMRVRSDTHD